jgi:hypothetical protein
VNFDLPATFNAAFDVEWVLTTIGTTMFSYGLIGLIINRADRWTACGWIAASQLLLGVANTSEGDYPNAALNAGLTAFNAYMWWVGGGAQQMQKLLQGSPKDQA